MYKTQFERTPVTEPLEMAGVERGSLSEVPPWVTWS